MKINMSRHPLKSLTMFSLIGISWTVMADNSDALKEMKIDSSRPLQIEYINEGWNKNPQVAEVGILIIRDKKTATTVKATLTEDGPNSNFFRGLFTINWKSDGPFQAEIYNPPEKWQQAGAKAANIETLVSKGAWPQKPYLLRPVNSSQVLTIFNSAEESLQAYAAFRKNADSELAKTSSVAAQASPSTLASLQTQATQDAIRKLEDLAESQSEERKALEAQQLREQQAISNEQTKMASEKKETLLAQAKTLSDEGLALYQKEDYLGAERKFRESLRLAPLNTQLYLQYGASLYRNKKYTQALVSLKMATGPDVDPREQAYFQGLCHLKLKELRPALDKFALVTSVIDDRLTPTASFYTGLIYFTQEKYDLSKMAFERTLDTSNNPDLDNKAESYIEKIAMMLQFQERLHKPFTINFGSELVYDSNIILLSNSSSGTSTKKDGFRANLDLGLDYRMIYNKTNEFQFSLILADTYSVDTGFKPSSTLQAADPLIVKASFPYRWKGKLFRKQMVVQVVPGYEKLYLNMDTEGLQDNVLNTQSLSLSDTVVASSNHLYTIDLTYRSEKAQVTSTAVSDAQKVALSSSQIYYLNEAKNRMFNWSWSLLNNNSKSTSLAFNQLGLSSGYLVPVGKDQSWMNTLSASYSDYAKSSDHRKDTNFNWSTKWQRPLSKGWDLSVGGGYEMNNSSQESSTYSKYLINTGVTWNGDF